MHKLWVIAETKHKHANMTVGEFLQHEFDDGRASFSLHTIMPNAGFQSSLFFRQMQFNNLIRNRISPFHLSNVTSIPAALLVTDYTPTLCTEDMEYHKQWRKSNSDKWPLHIVTNKDMVGNYKGDRLDRINSDAVNKDTINAPEMCLEYAEFVSNSKISFSTPTIAKSLVSTNQLLDFNNEK